MSDFSEALRRLLDDTQLFDRDEWTTYLGVEKGRIDEHRITNLMLSPRAKSNIEFFFGIVGMITTIVAATWLLGALILAIRGELCN